MRPAARKEGTFGNYTLVAKLATGGMAEIFLAVQQGVAGFEKLVCIKRILPVLAKDEVFVSMFLAEAKVAAQISHANVCQVFDLGEIKGSYFIAMEFLEGVPLSSFRRQDLYPVQLDPRLVVALLVQACEGLHTAHELTAPDGSSLGVVHRDVSANNLFVTVGGTLKVLDFGIAKVEGAAVRTRTGSLKGTLAYMSPEQVRAQPIDRRSDVFALGVVAWEMFGRKHLFTRDNEFMTFQAIIEDPIPDVAELRPDVPPALAAAIARALERDRERRFPTARAFGEALIAAIQPLGGPLPASAISAEVERSFATALSAQRALIKRAREGDFITLDREVGDRPEMMSMATAFADTSIDDQVLEATSAPTVPTAGTRRPATPIPTAPRRRRGWIAVLALAVAAIGGAAAYVQLHGQAPAPPAASERAMPVAATPLAAPPVAPPAAPTAAAATQPEPVPADPPAVAPAAASAPTPIAEQTAPPANEPSAPPLAAPNKQAARPSRSGKATKLGKPAAKPASHTSATKPTSEDLPFAPTPHR